MHPGSAVKEAISPSVAESVRSVFAAFIWHEGVTEDAMAIASYLKFHPGLLKKQQKTSDQELLRESKASSESKTDTKRHSVEVISSSYLTKGSVVASFASSATSGANANRNANKNANFTRSLEAASTVKGSTDTQQVWPLTQFFFCFLFVKNH